MPSRRRQSLPPVSPKVSNDLKPMVAAIKEIIETGEGVRGDPLDRKITLRDLIDSGIGSFRQGASANTPGGLTPTTPPPKLSTPPRPTNFNAQGAFDGRINLTWTIPGSLYSNHAYTKIYRAESDNFANAVLIGQEAGSFYTDSVRDDVTVKPYWYWIAFLSTANIEGPLNATAGTQAQALLDPDYVIEQIQGLVSESELAAELLTPIQAIPSIQTTVSDHGGRIASTEADLSDLLNIPAYDTATDYAIDDLVSYNGSAWRALTAMTAPAPTPAEGANWTAVGNYATFSDIIAANAAAIDDLDVRITSNDGVLTSYGTDITAIQNRVTDTENDTTTNSGAIGELDSRVTVAEGGITANSSDITLLQNDLTTAEGDITGNSTALNLLDGRVTTAEGTITAQASDITQLQTDVSNLDVDGNAAALQALDTRVTSNEDEITAQASDITTLTTSVGNNTSAIQTKAEVTAVQDLESDVAVLSAQYAVKLDVNGYVSGVALANNGTTSEFIVASDAVYFIDPGQSIEAFNPGTNYSSIDDVRDTQLVFGYAEVEGFKRFVINVPAYIPEGYITSGQVGEIGFGKITDSQGNPVTTVGGLLKADYIDVDNLSVAEAATFFGDAQSGSYGTGVSGWRLLQTGNAEFNDITARGHIEMDTGYIADGVSIGGLGSFAYKGSLFYSEVTGTKPPTDADNTGSNTSANTNAVAGTAATTVRDQASGAEATTNRVNSWTRPGQTLIDGNKIFTGDAYVDTLQIAGNAITLLQAQTGGSYTGSSGWRNLISFTYYTGVTSGDIDVLVNWGGVITGGQNGGNNFYDTNARLRIVIGGSAGTTVTAVGISQRVGVGMAQKYSFGNAGVRIRVQYYGESTTTASGGINPQARHVYASVIGTKR